MRTAIVAVLLALLVACAGCASPQDETEEGGQPAEGESPSPTDNEAGAEPVNPPNETNGTEGGATVNPTDDNESGTNETGENETGGNETANVALTIGSVGDVVLGG